LEQLQGIIKKQSFCIRFVGGQFVVLDRDILEPRIDAFLFAENDKILARPGTRDVKEVLLGEELFLIVMIFGRHEEGISIDDDDVIPLQTLGSCTRHEIDAILFYFVVDFASVRRCLSRRGLVVIG